MTYAQATARLPDHARWSASFGNPGEGGYVEYYRDAPGNRYVLANGSWEGNGKVWTFDLVPACGPHGVNPCPKCGDGGAL